LQRSGFGLGFRRARQLIQYGVIVVNDERAVGQQFIVCGEKVSLNAFLGQVGRVALAAVFELRVALPDGAAILVVGVPDLAAVPPAAASAS